MDMVPATAPGVQHDWAADPIQLVRPAPDWIAANGTTLGADDGIGMAAILAVLDLPGDAALPPIQALFTVRAGVAGGARLRSCCSPATTRPRIVALCHCVCCRCLLTSPDPARVHPCTPLPPSAGQ